MQVSGLVWAITLVALVAILVFDVFVIGRRPHEPSTRECATAIGVYSAGALAFAGFVWWHWRAANGQTHATEFVAGWLTEYSLSVDNLFIFLLIMQKMQVPRKLQQFALMTGIILALVFRGAFIAVGAKIIELFAWVFFLFGAFLLYTAVDLVLDYVQKDTQEEATENFAIRWVKRRFHFTDEFHGTRLRTKIGGRHVMTPMFLVIVALGSTDLLFALDSIPAIFGLTQQPYLVFAANVFALMGLRQLYFLIGSMLRKLVYLSIGLSVILAFIGVKLVLHALHHYGVIDWEVPTLVSLGVIVVVLAVTTVASLWKTRSLPPAVTPLEPGASEGA